MKPFSWSLALALGASLVAGCSGAEKAPEPEPKTTTKSPAEPPEQPGEAPPFGKPRAKLAPGQVQPVKDDAQDGGGIR